MSPVGRRERFGVAGNAERTFEDLYRQTYRKTLAYALRRTTSTSDAHDVVAETYLVAWRRLDAFLDMREPQAWLYGVAYRVLANQRRSTARRTSLIEKAKASRIETSVDPALTTEARDELDRVAAAMSTLSDRDQEALRLAAYEGLDHREIAVALESSAALVRTILYRARQRLNRALDSQDARLKHDSGHKSDVDQTNPSSQPRSSND